MCAARCADRGQDTNVLTVVNFGGYAQTHLTDLYTALRLHVIVIIYGSSDSERRLLDKLPGEVTSTDDMYKVRADFEYKRKKASGWFGWLRRWNYQRQIDKINRGMNDPLRAGASGEKAVLGALAILDDSYHVFCDLHIRLPYTVKYNGRKNLRSAQMDLVVACPKGVFVIEVKNWSDRYAANPSWSPHEQTDRAGRVLWFILRDDVEWVRVTKVLLSIRGNIPYDPDYRTVQVSDPDKIARFLKDRPDTISQKDLARIIAKLKNL